MYNTDLFGNTGAILALPSAVNESSQQELNPRLSGERLIALTVDIPRLIKNSY